MKTIFEGILPAIVSPCDEKDIFLEDVFAAHAKYLYKQGINGLYVCGATGEGHRMRLKERKRAAELAVEVSKEFPGTVIIHIGTPGSRDAIELAEHATKIGADAVASMPPPGLNHLQLVNYYKDICSASQLPVFVYHIPCLTHYTFTLEEILQLVDIKGVAGLKFTDWNLFLMKQIILARPNLVIFNGFDEVLLPGLLYGANGGIGSWYNVFPKLFLEIYRSVKNEEIRRALECQNAFNSLIDICQRHIIELLLKEGGTGPHCFRRPRATIKKEILKEILPDLRKKIDAIERVLRTG